MTANETDAPTGQESSGTEAGVIADLGVLGEWSSAEDVAQFGSEVVRLDDETERLMTDGGTTRREYMGGLASLAAAEWATEDYDIENAENWDAPVGGVWTVANMAPKQIIASAATGFGTMEYDDKNFTQREVEVTYTESGVNVDIDAEGDEPDHGAKPRVGALATFDPEGARELAVAIYMAAEELDRRPDREDA